MSFSEWTNVKLSDITSKITKGTTPTTIGASFIEKGVNYIKSECITASRLLDRSKYAYISEETHEKLKRSQILINDILFSMAGMFLGKTGIVFEQDIPANTNQAVAIIRVTKELADYKYIYYYLNQKKIQDYVNGSTSQSAQPNINLKQIGDINVIIPPLSEQKVIAHTLSCIDDKIELNNHINKTLEEMAQAIFKSWFVDFEPFQDGAFEDGELGKIPKGWRVGTISDLGEVVGGSTPSKAKSEYYTEKGVAWITPKDLSNNKYKFISKGNIDITESGLKNSSTKIMPKDTVLFSSRAPIGYVAIAKNDVTTNQGFKSVVPKMNIGTAYVYCFLKNNIEMIESRATGSTFKEVSGSIMKQIPALIPNDSILLKFQDICNLYFEQQMLLENQNQALTIIRDSLLPKLMSGEIRVPLNEVY